MRGSKPASRGNTDPQFDPLEPLCRSAVLLSQTLSPCKNNLDVEKSLVFLLVSPAASLSLSSEIYWPFRPTPSLAFLALSLSVFWIWLGEPKPSKTIHNWILCMLNHTHLLTGWPWETAKSVLAACGSRKGSEFTHLGVFPIWRYFFKLNSIQIFQCELKLVMNNLVNSKLLKTKNVDKGLLHIFSPHQHWKPSEGRMEALVRAIITWLKRGSFLCSFELPALAAPLNLVKPFPSSEASVA